MSTTLEPSFLRACVLLCGFKGGQMKAAQACLLLMALRQDTMNAAMMPAELTHGSRHLAGAATGALIAQGLLEVVGRVKSPVVSAKGRKLDVLAIPQGKRSTVQTWLRSNGFEPEQPANVQQLELLSA